MTAPKKKTAARKPAAKKPAAKPAAKSEDPIGDINNIPQGSQGDPPTDPAPEPKKKSLPGYLTKRILSDKERENLIEDFNKSFDAEFPKKLKSPATLGNMQRRLLNQVYHK